MRGGSRKARVARAFSRAAETYDRAAAVQRQVAAQVAERILAAPPPPGGRIVEVGCGTGLLSERLVSALPGRQWLLTDLSAAMLASCRERIGEREGVSYEVMDGEHPTLEAGSVDAIVSSLAFQWFDDLGAALSRLRRCLRPGGRLVFSTVGEETFHEWRACLHQAGALPGPSSFPSAGDLAGLGVSVEEERIPTRFESGRAFLEHLADLGATVPAPGQTPLSLQRLREAMVGFKGVATYHILYGELRA